MATKKETTREPKENLASLFGKLPEIDVAGFRRERKKEIHREHSRDKKALHKPAKIKPKREAKR